MARQLRSDLPDGFYHVTARGVARAPVFLDDRDRRTFLSLLADCVRRFHWCCYAFCLMGNHYHLVLESTRVHLSLGMKRLNAVHAQCFNIRYGRSGHLFGSRFAAVVIDSEEYLETACLYVISNPVRAGLCARAADWPWAATRWRRASTSGVDEHTFAR